MEQMSLSLSGTGYSRVGDAIRERIISGQYQPGVRLKINDLCTDFGISSNPVREALQQLQGEGLVVILPNKGAMVRSIDEDLIRHIYDIGAGIDGILARRCAAMATTAQVEKLRQMQLQMERYDDLGDEVLRGRLNGEFHSELGMISGNLEAWEIRKKHHILIGVIRLKYGHAPGRFAEVKVEHWAIINAIADGDPDAAEFAARHHCLRSCEDALAQFRSK
ncbi:GntR family transcriptional regulator [Mesorhizobium sp. YR577]|uniref:GntR family transcriptional regulator n=1 Tax=Mesorhizobium sp. YR577 TaxID=1884373 RepID=UPI0008F0906F|nr:GntR family transcriptional regulator [Mesorhizobium sp. YR577]SFU23312.1 transcriptional regulator, GntR family [Mesorhizobium sp. YR577]